MSTKPKNDTPHEPATVLIDSNVLLAKVDKLQRSIWLAVGIISCQIVGFGSHSVMGDVLSAVWLVYGMAAYFSKS